MIRCALAAAQPLALSAALMAAPAALHADEPGAFDYYVLALSWSPTWCALEGDAQDSPQCDRREEWVLHGLWPQHEAGGWPEYCHSPFPDPSRSQTRAMADIHGTDGLAWHAWNKHGSCSGLSATDYYGAARAAYEAVAFPEAFARLPGPVAIPADVVEEAFLRADPSLDPDGVTIACRSGRIAEVRLCLTRELDPRPCASDVRRDCTLDDALMDPA